MWKLIFDLEIYQAESSRRFVSLCFFHSDCIRGCLNMLSFISIRKLLICTNALRVIKSKLNFVVISLFPSVHLLRDDATSHRKCSSLIPRPMPIYRILFYLFFSRFSTELGYSQYIEV